MIGLQVLIALPFVSDPVANALGYENGAGTSLEKYLWFTRFAGGSKDTRRGAVIAHTVYFFYLSNDFYHSEEFILYTRLAIIFVNVYYFFLRSGCMFQCIKNIVPWNLPKHTSIQRTKVIEVMVILYVSGINFTPGGHGQF